MNNILFCYAVKDAEDLKSIHDYKSISSDPENFQLCITREKSQEIEYFSNKGRAIFFNPETREFTETDFTPVEKSLVNYTIWPRVDIPNYWKLIYPLLERGWNPISKPYEYLSVERWMRTIPPQFINRRIIPTTKISLQESFDSIYSSIKNERGEFFVKSIKKDWSYSGSLSWWYDGPAYSLEKGSGDDEVMLSEFIDIGEDEYDMLEWRCFVVDGLVLSISRYKDYESIPTPDKVSAYAREVVNHVAGKYLPKNFVLDVAQKRDGEICIIEFNDVCCSGRYVDNTVESFDI